MVAAVSSATAAAQGVTAASKSSGQEQEDRFLKLLVAQMKNQDPLNPLDNAQVTSQMAQISTVSGIEKLNQALSTFAQSQSFQAAGMIGHRVLAPGNTLALQDGGALAGFDLAQAVDAVKVNVMDANGVTVRTLDLGAQDAGSSMFAWDGLTNTGATAPAGNYRFQVSASQAGAAVSAQSLAVGLVNSVVMGASGPSLSVQGMGSVDLNQVKQIL